LTGMPLSYAFRDSVVRPGVALTLKYPRSWVIVPPSTYTGSSTARPWFPMVVMTPGLACVIAVMFSDCPRLAVTDTPVGVVTSGTKEIVVSVQVVAPSRRSSRGA
jgi:hypothetical protein